MTSYHGKAMYYLTYPISSGTLINVVVFVTDPSSAGTHYEGHWVSEGSHDELVESFNDFELAVKTLVKLCDKPSKWALHAVKPLPFCVRKRIALIGDACHAMTPHFGAGAGQAIDDAFVLGRLIAHPLTTLSRVPEALRIYDEIRLPFARSVASLSLSNGSLYMFLEPGYYDGTRKGDDLDESLKQDILRRRNSMDALNGMLQPWDEAESKLNAVAGQTAN